MLNFDISKITGFSYAQRFFTNLQQNGQLIDWSDLELGAYHMQANTKIIFYFSRSYYGYQ